MTRRGRYYCFSSVHILVFMIIQISKKQGVGSVWLTQWKKSVEWVVKLIIYRRANFRKPIWIQSSLSIYNLLFSLILKLYTWFIPYFNNYCIIFSVSRRLTYIRIFNPLYAYTGSIDDGILLPVKFYGYRYYSTGKQWVIIRLTFYTSLITD